MGLNWQAISILRSQWQANVSALRTRDPVLADAIEKHRPAGDYIFATEENGLHLGRRAYDRVEPLPNPVPLTSVREIAKKLYPTGECTEPVLVAGLDQGWLWQALYELPCNTPRTPGHRPPLYLLTGDIERFWLVLHLHDWEKLLGDGRMRIFVGDDCVEQCQRSMIQNVHVPWPKLSV